MSMDRNQPIYRRPGAPRADRKPPAPDHDAYLKAACDSRIPIAVFFLDGEVIERATVRQVHMFTVLLEVGGADVLVYKNALKKITSVSKGVAK